MNTLEEYLETKVVTEEILQTVERLVWHIWRYFRQLDLIHLLDRDDMGQQCWVLLLSEDFTTVQNKFNYLCSALKHWGFRQIYKQIRNTHIDPHLRYLVETGCKVEGRASLRGLKALVRESGISYTTAKARIRGGWELAEAISVPVCQLKKKGNIDPGSVKQLAKERGIKYVTVQKRLARGWELEKALAGPLVVPTVKASSLTQRAKRAGLNPQTVCERIKRGWTEEEAFGLVPRK